MYSCLKSQACHTSTTPLSPPVTRFCPSLLRRTAWRQKMEAEERQPGFGLGEGVTHEGVRGALQPHPRGVVDLHLGQKFPVDAEVAETSSLVVDDAVALAGHGDEPGPQTQLWPLQGPEQVPGDGVDQAGALCTQPEGLASSTLSHTGTHNGPHLTFGAADHQPQLGTHRHTHHLVVVSSQHRSGSGVVACRSQPRSQPRSQQATGGAFTRAALHTSTTHCCWGCPQ